jgi:DNA processing protein
MFGRRSGACRRLRGMSVAVPAEAAALVALLRARPGRTSWSEITADVLERGSAVDLWEAARQPTLFDAEIDAALEAARADIAGWMSDGTRMLTILDDDYPERLRAIHQAPPVLFVRGDLRAEDPAVSIVGSRSASQDGINVAGRIAREVGQLGITVASGLALGIDAAAHRTALAAGSRTVAFLGTGIRRKYPRENGALQDEIAARGLLVSQFWPDAPPRKHTFLMRNAVMSGYGLATIVVEAGEMSGSRAQARMAVEHGRPVILLDRVVTANAWARGLVGRAGVLVVSSLAETLAAVEKFARRDAGDSPVNDAFESMLA